MSSNYRDSSQEQGLTGSYGPSSASTGRSTVDFEPAEASDKAGFWRWSRNLSAHRYRELDRLNQIELKRQILELKTQDGLLEQLTDKPRSPINDSVSSQTAPEPVPGQADLEESKISSFRKDHDDYDDLDATSRHRRRGLVDESEGDKHLQLEHDTDEKPAQVSPLICDSNARTSLETGASRLTIESDSSTWQLDGDVNGANDRTTKASVKSSLKASVSSKQLVEFAFAQVPKSKRVLCLIVRNKMYSLNKANSYFYPTYYLIIQEIVDIDDHLRELESPLNMRSDEEVASRALNSADNSFSASSSISADMLFIGNNQNTSNVHVDNFGGTSGGGGGQIGRTKLPASSYSDNETEADNDHESEPNPMSKSRHRKVTGKFANELESSNSAILSDLPEASTTNIGVGRDNSSLIFPNMVVASNRHTRSKGLDSTSSSRAKQPSNVAGNTELGLFDAQKTYLFANNSESQEHESIDVDSNDDDGSDSNEQVSNSGHSGLVANANAPTNDSDDNANPLDLFEDKLNPYSGTYAILLTGRRRKKAKTYLIGLNEKGYTRKNSVCKLKSNVLGTQFNAIRCFWYQKLTHISPTSTKYNHRITRRNLTDSEDSSTIASIIYETNVLGFKGPRKMRVFLEKDKHSDLGMKNITEAYKKDPSLFVELRNITPSWNIESQSYVLNFHGRVTQASVKNFQLVESNERADIGPITDIRAFRQTRKSASTELDGHPVGTEDRKGVDARLDEPACRSPSSMADGRHQISNYNNSIVMQFGRISDHEFTCDVSHPLSIIQAFAIALSSFDSKLACE